MVECINVQEPKDQMQPSVINFFPSRNFWWWSTTSTVHQKPTPFLSDLVSITRTGKSAELTRDNLGNSCATF